MNLFGFGFNLLMILIVIPCSIGLIGLWLVTWNKIFGQILGLIWGSIFSLLFIIVLIQPFGTKMKVTKSKIYGTYVIDKSKFPGKQADWQYDNFNFKITKKDELLFSYISEGDNFKTDTIKVRYLEHYYSHRLILDSDSTSHHIVHGNPTLYRNIWNFYYVFESEKFGNVFFKKKKFWNR